MTKIIVVYAVWNISMWVNFFENFVYEPKWEAIEEAKKSALVAFYEEMKTQQKEKFAITNLLVF